MKSGPVRNYSPPNYATKDQALRDSALRARVLPRRVLRHPLVAFLGVLVATGVACAYGCEAELPTVYLSEDEALDIIRDEFARNGVSLEDGGAEDAKDLPFTPDLVNRVRNIAVEFVTRQDCGSLQSEGMELMVQTNSTPSCDVQRGLVTADTGEPRVYYQDVWEASDCNMREVANSMAEALQRACYDVWFLGAWQEVFPGDSAEVAEDQLRSEVGRFLDDMRRKGVI